MLRKIPWPWVMLYATLALFGVASYFRWYSMWGINHLAFLPSGWWVVYWLAVAAITALALLRDPTPRLDRLIERIGDLLFERGVWPRVVVASLFGLVFYFLRLSVHLLGDGYTWLAVFSSGDLYVPKWTEIGGIWLLRVLQSALGGYTYDTALRAFQITSIVSGIAYVFLATTTIRLLVQPTESRIIGFVLLIGSGAILMFFGYAEFYAPLWPITLLLVLISIRAMNDRRWVFLVIVVLLFGTLVHLQMIILLPGITYLLAYSISHKHIRKTVFRTIVTLAIFTILGVVVAVRFPSVAILTLPFLEGRPIAPNYSVFSLIHALDLTNLLFLVCPSIFLIAVALRRKFRLDGIDWFFAFLATGSIVFVLLYGAAITMARDWDVMAFGFLPPLLCAVWLLRHSGEALPVRLLCAFAVVTMTLAASYIAVSRLESSAENRFHSLLNERSRNGYVILSNYYGVKGDSQKANQVIAEMNEQFPDYQLLKKAYMRLERNDLNGAHEIALDLVNKDSTQADFLQIMGNLHGKRNNFDSANIYYERALAYNPYNNAVLNEYGQLLIKQGSYAKGLAVFKRANSLPPPRSFIKEGLALAYYYQGHGDSACMIADSLFASNPDSPGGHLIYLIVNLQRGDLAEARRHYESYLVSGKTRSDYEGIREHYQYLTK